MPQTEALPDPLRSKRTDGRRWRCYRPVILGMKLCEVHHLQGRHRQCKKKVPESLKLQSMNRSKPVVVTDNVVHSGGEFRVKKGKKKKNFAKFGKLGKPMKNRDRNKELSREGGKRMRGGLQLELIRMVLKREVEKRQRKKWKKGPDAIDSGSEVDGENEVGSISGDCDNSSEGELMRDLPNGFMAISPVKGFGNWRSSSSLPCDVKIGGAEFTWVGRRCFRSKNIEPMPIGSTLQT